MSRTITFAAYFDITESDLRVGSPRKGIVVSAFANRDFCLVLGNLGKAEIELAAPDDYVSVARKTGRAWKLGPRTLLTLKRTAV